MFLFPFVRVPIISEQTKNPFIDEFFNWLLNISTNIGQIKKCQKTSPPPNVAIPFIFVGFGPIWVYFSGQKVNFKYFILYNSRLPFIGYIRAVTAQFLFETLKFRENILLA